MTTPMSAERFADRFRFYSGKPQQQRGVQMVAIPIANDQPGGAARVAWSGSGAVVPLKCASAARLRAAIDQVWGDPSYRSNAQRLQQAIAAAGGVARAADIVEQAINTGQPVL